MYVCITDAEGAVLVHENQRTDPEAFERTIEPYREDLAVAVEDVFVGTGSRTCVRSSGSPLSQATRCTWKAQKRPEGFCDPLAGR
jgi:hypothetical protein